MKKGIAKCIRIKFKQFLIFVFIFFSNFATLFFRNVFLHIERYMTIQLNLLKITGAYEFIRRKTVEV